MPTTGEKPGKGKYKCKKCGKVITVYFNPKGYQYFIPKVYHSNLIKKVNSTLFQGYPWNRVLLRRRFSLFSSFLAHHLFGFFQTVGVSRSEEHTSELQSRPHLVCRLLLEKKKQHT